MIVATPSRLALLFATLVVASCGSLDTYRVGSSGRVDGSQAPAVLAERVAAEARLPSGEPVSPPIRLLEGAPPQTPPSAAANRIQGDVDVLIDFTAQGTVGRVTVVRSAHEILSRAVVQAVERWRIEPREAFTARQSFSFRLER